MTIVTLPPPPAAARRRSTLVAEYRSRFGVTPCPWSRQDSQDFERKVRAALRAGAQDPSLLTVEARADARRQGIIVD